MNKKIIILFISLMLSLSLISFSQIKMVSNNNIIDIEPTIIIDAGHGGEDGGAIGIDNTPEKNINLDISNKLNDILSLLGYNTKMIRKTDISIHDNNADTIRKRKISDIHNRFSEMSNFENCVYISIHQNEYSDNRIWGTQTFYTANNPKSKMLAELIQKSIVGDIQQNNKRIPKKAGSNLYILYNAIKPAVLVECGFMSNAKELALLKDDAYQNQLAMTISKGIINYYIWENLNGSKI